MKALLFKAKLDLLKKISSSISHFPLTSIGSLKVLALLIRLHSFAVTYASGHKVHVRTAHGLCFGPSHRAFLHYAMPFTVS